MDISRALRTLNPNVNLVGFFHTDPSKAKDADRGILCSVKASTTPDVTSGIKTAIANALEQAKIDHDSVSAVMIGTTVCHAA